VKRSFLSGAVFPLFAWGLAFHSLIMAALFGWFGLPEQVVRAVAAWKEIALALLIVVVILRAVTGRGNENIVTWADLWVGGLMATAVLFLLTENLWLRFNLPQHAEFLGIRDAVYFMLAYFVGRATPELASDEKTMRMLFVLIVVTCTIGIVERFIVSPEMLVGMGVASYFQDFLGVSAFTGGNEYGLPGNYWTMIGGARSPRKVIAFTIVSVGLILTLTRMTLLIALIQLVLFVAIRKRPEWAVAGLAIASTMFLAAFVTIPGFPTFVWHTLSWQEGSSVSHLNDWIAGVAVFLQNPWGSGLGTTDQTAVRAGLAPLTGDNLYLKYGVELGIAGLTFFVLILSALGSAAMRLYRQGSTIAQQRMGMTLWLTSVGIAINSITAAVFNSITLSWIFFWLAGAAVTVAQSLPGTSPFPARRDVEGLPAPAS
jgi:O-antigen ligase/polysaccharide polymerase Wzy-like membrane protein